MVLLETSFIVDLFKGRPVAVDLYRELKTRRQNICVSSPTIMELWEGVQYAKLSHKERAKVEEMLVTVTVLPLDGKAAKYAGEIRAASTKSGMSVDIIDCLIGAIALANGEILVTRDSDFAKIPGLRLLKY